MSSFLAPYVHDLINSRSVNPLFRRSNNPRQLMYWLPFKKATNITMYLKIFDLFHKARIEWLEKQDIDSQQMPNRGVSPDEALHARRARTARIWGSK